MNTLSNSSFNYSAFEAFFRGTPHEIRERLSVYLPLASLVHVDDSNPALDIGCGRGEWLELLRESGIPAAGIDSNSEFAGSCQQQGLDVLETDLFSFFERQVASRYSLITGFHLIEHISPEKQPFFLAAVLNLLAPGGVLILETPNPENVTVGSCNFYIDPTHCRPVPPHLLLFMAVQAGFSSPMIVRLNRKTVGEPLRLMPSEEPYASLYNRLVDIVSSRILQAPDYALVAFTSPSPSLAMLEAVSAINRQNDMFVLPPLPIEGPEEIDIAHLHQRTIELEKELRIVQELLEPKDSAFPPTNMASATKEQSVPLNEFAEPVRRSYLTLLSSRLISKNKTS